MISKIAILRSWYDDFNVIFEAWEQNLPRLICISGFWISHYNFDMRTLGTRFIYQHCGVNMARGIFCSVHRLIWGPENVQKSSYIVIFAKYGPLLSHLYFAKEIMSFDKFSFFHFFKCSSETRLSLHISNFYEFVNFWSKVMPWKEN